MTTMFSGLSDADVLKMLHTQADACVAIVAMPDEEANRIGPKGEASPRQAGAMNALFAMLAEREAAARGLVTPTL